MSVIRQQQWYGQQRVDVAHLRSIESGVAGDFDVLAGQIFAGTAPLVVKGFQVITTNAVGSPVTSLQVSTAGSILIHYLASESGSIFSVPANRATEVLSSSNVRIRGSFTANTTNYLGVDLRRSSDSSTADIVQFINTANKVELAQRVALARTLDYVFVISTSDFSSLSGVCPIAKIVTDANNNVSSITDARNMLGRLGSGGTVPNPNHTYSWPGGRTEIGDNSDFSAGDKAIPSLKDWMNASMMRTWEIGGGEHWYSRTADRNVKLVRTGSPFGTGDWFYWDGSDLTWQGLVFIFNDSTGYYNVIKDQLVASPGLTNLAVGECVYVDLDRSQNLSGGSALQAHKATLASLGSPTIPGSRWVLAWRAQDGTVIVRDAGTTLPIASTTVLGITRISHNTAGTYTGTVMSDPSPVAISEGGRDRAHGFVGLDANIKASVTSTTGDAITGASGAGNGSGLKGTGNGSGAGVVGIGGATGGGGDFTGGAAGPGITAHANGSDDSAIARWKDKGGNIKGLVDHNGFPELGRITVMRENWMYPYSPANGIASLTDIPGNTMGMAHQEAAADGSDGVEVGSLPPSGMMGPCVSLFQNSSTSACVVITQTSIVHATAAFVPAKTNTNGGVYIMECEVAGSVMGSGNGCDLFIGFKAGGVGSITGGVDCVGIRKRNTDTTWQLVTGDGATNTHTNTTVACTTNNQVFKVKIEYHTTNSPFGAMARVFINGTLTTSTSTLPTHPMEWAAENFGQTVSAGGFFYVGPLLIAYNRFLTPGDN